MAQEMTNDAAAHAAMLAQEKLSGAAKKLLGLQPVHKTKSKASKMSEMRAIEDKLKRELSHSKTNTGSAFAKEKQGSPLESRQHSGLMDPGGSLSSSTLERQSSSTVLGLEDPSSMLTARTDAVRHRHRLSQCESESGLTREVERHCLQTNPGAIPVEYRTVLCRTVL